eukprot:scaffold22788_cov128-Isochrysis_galbana.AAC.1
MGEQRPDAHLLLPPRCLKHRLEASILAFVHPHQSPLQPHPGPLARRRGLASRRALVRRALALRPTLALRPALALPRALALRRALVRRRAGRGFRRCPQLGRNGARERGESISVRARIAVLKLDPGGIGGGRLALLDKFHLRNGKKDGWASGEGRGCPLSSFLTSSACRFK